MTDNNSKSRIEILKQFITEDANDTFSLYVLALEYAKTGNLIEAIALLRQVLENDSQYLAAYYQLGSLYEESRNIKEAKEIYEKGIIVAQQQGNIKTLNELRSALAAQDDWIVLNWLCSFPDFICMHPRKVHS